MPDGQTAGSVNDGVRALEGILARWSKDTNGSLVSTGSANVFALAANRTIASYTDGLSFTFEVATANTNTATLNVDAVGAQAIVWPDGTALRSGDMPAEAKVTVRYDLGNTRWLLCTVSVAPADSSVLATEQATTSGTAIDFTSIPSWVKKITILLDQVSTDGAEELMVQLGDAGGFETSNYAGAASSATNAPAIVTDAFSDGFLVNTGNALGDETSGALILTLMDAANNTWVAHGVLSLVAGGVKTFVTSGIKSLTATLTQIRLTSTGTPDTFDAGAVNILYE